jgi:hypothetical protein
VASEGRQETGQQRDAGGRPNVVIFHLENLGFGVLERRITAERAEETYGVVLDPYGDVVREATRAERAVRTSQPLDANARAAP